MRAGSVQKKTGEASRATLKSWQSPVACITHNPCNRVHACVWLCARMHVCLCLCARVHACMFACARVSTDLHAGGQSEFFWSSSTAFNTFQLIQAVHRISNFGHPSTQSRACARLAGQIANFLLGPPPCPRTCPSHSRHF
eukprot:scaffold159734_cov14-Tisochrysis_lutea.AAC.2